jgi:hypothetical protein
MMMMMDEYLDSISFSLYQKLSFSFLSAIIKESKERIKNNHHHEFVAQKLVSGL